MNSPDSPSFTAARRFALQVVKTLRDAGYEALWAGGCVRDDLLGLCPKDYDVATNATPQKVIEIFGSRRTVPVGVSFGVVMVNGPAKASGHIEVATFRADGAYIDGRRPVDVRFCSAREDALRRDFTINGMFYDPVNDQVIDYVGGRDDLEAGIVRAIGNARDRFTEDKLRMLRAVRFAATYRFKLDTDTATAVRELCSEVTLVSVERIAQEMKRMLADSSRARSFRLLEDTGLLRILFPDISGQTAVTAPPSDRRLETTEILDRLRQPAFEPSFAVLLWSLYRKDGGRLRERTMHVHAECRRLKLSNDETDTICWLADSVRLCHQARLLPLRVLKPLLADRRSLLLLDLLRARHSSDTEHESDAEFLENYRQSVPAETLNPAPLIDGADLKNLGIRPGPAFKDLLNTIRDEQLDEQIHSREEALARVKQIIR